VGSTPTPGTILILLDNFPIRPETCERLIILTWPTAHAEWMIDVQLT